MTNGSRHEKHVFVFHDNRCENIELTQFSPDFHENAVIFWGKQQNTEKDTYFR